MKIFTAVSLLAITFAAFITDSRTGKIPNRLCLLGLALAVFCRVVEHRWFSIADLPLTTVLLTVLLFAYRLRGLGGGDVKLLLILMILLSGKTALRLTWIAMLLAGAAGIIVFISTKAKTIRLGPAIFLASLVTISIGGIK